jgi:integrase
MAKKALPGIRARGRTWYFHKWIGGHAYRESTGFRVGTKSNRENALRWAVNREAEIRAGNLGWKPKVPTFATYWTATYQPVYTARKRAPHRDVQMMAPALPVFGPMRLDEITPSDCERYLNARLGSLHADPTGKKRPKVISQGTVSRERQFLQGVMQRAVNDGVIDKNPWRGIARKAYAVRERLLTPAEQNRLLVALTPHYQRFVLFMLGTGLRLEECRGIVPARDLNLETRHVTVTGKFGKTRQVPLPAELLPTIKAQLESGRWWTQNQQHIRYTLAQACKAREGREPRTSRRGRLVAAVAPLKALPTLSPHVFRHTFGWRWLQGGGDIYTLSKVLGHASVSVTERHYAHLLKEDIQGKADRVDLGLGLTPPAKVVRMRGRR